MGGGRDGQSPIDALKARLEAPDYRTPEERSKAQKRNLQEGLDLFLGGRTAGEMGEDIYEAAKTEDSLGVAREAGMAALETGLTLAGAKGPGKGAKDRLNVLVPADDLMAQHAADMRKEGKALSTIWRATGRAVSPEGKIKAEIPDNAMEVAPLRSSNLPVPLSEVVQHPELFDRVPELKNQPVRVVPDIEKRGNPVARTDESGNFKISEQHHDPAGALAKLMQYRIGEASGFAAPVRHGSTQVMRSFDDALISADAAKRRATDPETRRTLDDYVQDILSRKNNLELQLQFKGNSNPAANMSRRSAGNLEAAAVAARTRGTGEQLARHQPYATQIYYGNRPFQGTQFDTTFALPPEDISPEEMMEFVRQWRTLGSGKK